MSTALTVAGLAPDDQLLKHLDVNNQNLQTGYEAQLGVTEKQHLPTFVQRIALKSQDEWEHARHGQPINAPQSLEAWHRLSQHEHEHYPQGPEDSSRGTTRKAQRLFMPATDQRPGQIPHFGN